MPNKHCCCWKEKEYLLAKTLISWNGCPTVPSNYNTVHTQNGEQCALNAKMPFNE